MDLEIRLAMGLMRSNVKCDCTHEFQIAEVSIEVVNKISLKAQ